MNTINNNTIISTADVMQTLNLLKIEISALREKQIAMGIGAHQLARNHKPLRILAVSAINELDCKDEGGVSIHEILAYLSKVCSYAVSYQYLASTLASLAKSGKITRSEKYWVIILSPTN